MKGVSGRENNTLQLKVSKDGRCRHKQGSDHKRPVAKEVSIMKKSEDEPLLLVSSTPFEGRFHPQTQFTGQCLSQNTVMGGAHHAEKGCARSLEETDPINTPLLFFLF